jgi:hypothetical protein
MVVMVMILLSQQVVEISSQVVQGMIILMEEVVILE